MKITSETRKTSSDIPAPAQRGKKEMGRKNILRPNGERLPKVDEKNILIYTAKKYNKLPEG